LQIQPYRYLITAVVLVLLLPCSAVAGSKEDAQNRVQRYVAEAQQDVELTRHLIEGEREQLLAEIASLEQSVAHEETNLLEVKGRFDGLLQREREVQTGFRQHWQDADRFLETYLATRKDVDTLLKSSLIQAESSSPLQMVNDADNPANSPTFADVRQLVEALFGELQSSGKIEIREGAFIGPDGTQVVGAILQLGDFNAYYRTTGGAGFLMRDKTADRLVAIPASSGWFDRNETRIKHYFDGKADVLPVDLSKGEVFSQFESSQNLLEWLNAGGFLVWPILLVGAVAFLLILERMIFLARTRVSSEKLIRRIRQLAGEGSWQKCREYCAGHTQASVCRVLQAGLGHPGADREILESALQEALMKELPRLERFLSTISVLAAIAPLLGLLGTVSGMINTFHAITIHGTGDPRMLSGGISEALVTTQLGLMVAVPVLILHHFLERRVDALIGDMEEKSTALTVIMLKNRGIRDGMVSRVA